ncbi:MAG: hypothetical protein JNM80_08020 [Phycisphaerae bacterium]|nr:hypothetical protein [Phycisphaerae bacterium]
MSIGVAKANLMDAAKQLRLKWDRLRPMWDDDVARQFEEKYVRALEPGLMAAVKGLDHVADLVAAVRRDCGDDGVWAG